jgi:hypothetical protein
MVVKPAHPWLAWQVLFSANRRAAQPCYIQLFLVCGCEKCVPDSSPQAPETLFLGLHARYFSVIHFCYLSNYLFSLPDRDLICHSWFVVLGYSTDRRVCVCFLLFRSGGRIQHRRVSSLPDPYSGLEFGILEKHKQANVHLQTNNPALSLPVSQGCGRC